MPPMTQSSIAQPAAAASGQSFPIQGREVRLPVEVRDSSAAVAYYLVGASAAQTLIEASGLRVARVLPGRALCTIGTMEYRDADLGPYREVAVTYFVHDPGVRTVPFLGTALGLARGGLSTYIHHLPVDSEFSRAAGCDIWGFPKFLAEIGISTNRDEQTSVLTVDGRRVLTQTMRSGGSRSFGERAQLSYAYRAGVLYRTPAVMRGADVRPALGGARLELGDHPIADELRSLGLPKSPLFSTFIGKMTGRFFAAEQVA
jgi:hypothetical protein